MQKRLVTRRGPQPMGPKPIKRKGIHTLLGGRLLPEMTESARFMEIYDFGIEVQWFLTIAAKFPDRLEEIAQKIRRAV